MSKKRNLIGLLSAALLLGLVPATTLAAPASQSSGTVLVSGLDNPRGLSMGQDGNLYVAEAGTGGPMEVTAPDGSKQKVGPSSKVTRVGLDGSKTTAVPDLLSATPEGGPEAGESIGASGAIYAGDSIWITGLYVDPTTQAPTFGLRKADPATGAVAPFANLAAYEATNNPDGNQIDSDPYGLTWGTDGQIYVADAAANDLLKVDPANGNISTVTVFPGIPLPPPAQQPGGNPDRGGRQETDPVPTGVSIAPDGSIYVGLLTGFPFLEGAAKVIYVGAGGNQTDAATGLTMVVDTEVGPDGNIYASEFAKFSLTSTPPGYVPNSGAVVRVLPGGGSEVVASGLTTPNGIAFDSAGNLYVAVNGDFPTGGDGQILRFDGVASPGSTPGMPRTGSADQPLEAIYVALLLMSAGLAMRALYARRRASR